MKNYLNILILLSLVVFIPSLVYAYQTEQELEKFLLDATGRQTELHDLAEQSRKEIKELEAKINTYQEEWLRIEEEIQKVKQEGLLSKETNTECDWVNPPEHFDDKQKWRFMHWQYGALEHGLSCEVAKKGTLHMMVENGLFDPERTNIGPIYSQCAIGIPQNHVRARWGVGCWVVQRLGNPDKFTKGQLDEARNMQCGNVKCGQITDYYWQRWDYWNQVKSKIDDGWSIEHVISSHLYGSGGVWKWTAEDLRKGRDWHYNTNGRKVYGYYQKVMKYNNAF